MRFADSSCLWHLLHAIPQGNGFTFSPCLASMFEINQHESNERAIGRHRSVWRPKQERMQGWSSPPPPPVVVAELARHPEAGAVQDGESNNSCWLEPALDGR